MAFPGIKISPEKLRVVIGGLHKSKAMIARELDISSGSLFHYLKGNEPVGVDPEVFHRMLSVFKVGPEALVSNGTPHPSNVADFPGNTDPIPTWDIHVAAGPWVDVPIASLDYDDPDQRRIVNLG